MHEGGGGGDQSGNGKNDDYEEQREESVWWRNTVIPGEWMGTGDGEECGGAYVNGRSSSPAN
jgi:hypothetical protein